MYTLVLETLEHGDARGIRILLPNAKYVAVCSKADGWFEIWRSTSCSERICPMSSRNKYCPYIRESKVCEDLALELEEEISVERVAPRLLEISRAPLTQEELRIEILEIISRGLIKEEPDGTREA